MVYITYIRTYLINNILAFINIKHVVCYIIYINNILHILLLIAY